MIFHFASWPFLVISLLTHSCSICSPQSNTFQAVLISDGVHTFLKYNYPCGGIQWAIPAKL